MKSMEPLALAVVLASLPAMILSQTANDKTATAPKNKSVFYDMSSENGSQKSGWAVIEPISPTKTRVRVWLQDTYHLPSPYPANIYFGVCSDLGGVAYPLTSISDGETRTDINESFDKFDPDSNGDRPLAIRVSWSATQIDKSVACGDPQKPVQSDVPHPNPQQVSLQLNAPNESGKTGWVVIEPVGTKTRVRMSVQGSPANSNYPANIYLGACGDPGGIVYALNNVRNGTSTTVLNVNFTTFKPGTAGHVRPMAVNVGSSVAQPNQSLLCGEFTGTGP